MLVISLAISDAAVAPTPVPSQPDFIDTFLASRAVVIAVRIAIIFAAVFVVLSVVALIARKQWLTRVGPVEVGAKRVSGIDLDSERLQLELEEARQVVNKLRQKISNPDRPLHKRGDDVGFKRGDKEADSRERATDSRG